MSLYALNWRSRLLPSLHQSRSAMHQSYFRRSTPQSAQVAASFASCPKLPHVQQHATVAGTE